MANRAPDSKNEDGQPTTQYRVEVLPHDHFAPKTHFTKEEAKTMEDDICTARTLNTEQERAFRLAAEHICNTNGDKAPLKMYLGGMGGTGKSAVFHAIKDLFKARNEDHRYLMLGPTGATAALVNGSTYHSVFRIPRETKSKNQDDIDGIPNDASSMASVNERIQGVEYILLDEISMVSCVDLQTL
ncbi:hypothetical protein C8R43DRAFT_910745, partial [Mycena crocata]